MTQGHEDNYESLLQNLSLSYPDIDWSHINLTNLSDFLLLDQTERPTAAGAGGSHTNATGPVLYQVPTGIVVLLSCFYGSISLVAVLGNALVIWIVATSRKMHSVTNYFIANLALADIIIGLFAIPFQFQAALLQRWNLPEFMCAFCPFFQTLSVNVSIFTLTAIAVDRYRAIVFPLNARRSKFWNKVLLAFVWLASTFLAVPNAIALRVKHVTDTRTQEQIPVCAPGINPVMMLAYSHAMVGLQFFVPLGIISFAYIRMGWELWGSRTPGNAEDARDAHVLKNKKKVIKMLFIVVALFAFCWAPLQTYHILQEIYPTINEYRYINIIWFCCHWLAMSNSCCNPFIYAIYNEKYKREFRHKFRWVFKEYPRRVDTSDLDRSRYHMSFRHPVERQVSSASELRTSRTDATQLNGSSRSSPHKLTLGTAGRATNGREAQADATPGGGPHHQEVHVCVPLKSRTHLHPSASCPRTGGDTRM
ncbi:substance-K receptor-like isoform X2 [Panulirus ornatus]|uniref:substance-K receptor-like isoform X2 n=1 Tax=Panulirus ornatus TaxID=150431 RepID=UPI003A88F2D1